MIQVELFLPVADNQGQTYKAVTDAVFHQKLCELFGGFSEMPGTVRGGWINNGVFYPDESRVMMVAIQSIGDGNKVREAAEFAKAHYGQLAILVRYLGLAEVM